MSQYTSNNHKFQMSTSSVGLIPCFSYHSKKITTPLPPPITTLHVSTPLSLPPSPPYLSPPLFNHFLPLSSLSCEAKTMEVPVIHRINDFQIASSSLAGIQSVSTAYNFCKWSALILALVAAFGSILNRIKFLILRLHHHTQSLVSTTNLLSDLHLDEYSSSDDESYSSPSTPSSSDYDHEEDDQADSSRSLQWLQWCHMDEGFQGTKGRHGRRCSIGDIFSISEIAKSESVVKLWDSIGFGLGLDFDLDEHEFSSSDLAADTVVRSGLTPAVVVSAGEGASGNLAVAVWDTRLRRRSPAVIAEWEGNEGRVVGVGAGGVEKVYVKDDVRYGVRVGDMRKVTAPLGNVTERDLGAWWDRDGVVISGETDDESFLRRKLK